MHELKAFPFPTQPFQDVLFFNARACPTHLFETAQQRLHAVCDLLEILEMNEGSTPLNSESARLSSAIGLLLGDARALYEAAFDGVRSHPVAKAEP
ncbi:hypothetical protein LMK08_15755 [Metapseudomonas furukawaii]|uniref:hypothetical protein n=1 Tax=Metapseudomonas furukawaii TaxID=1149133 RepID=UPI00227A9782|nr:hypothetical protein [Pseudomonas furukawaii]WAG76833.1 hypothetical protein LMK08_15755 [Pseudomonas furukawaii]